MYSFREAAAIAADLGGRPIEYINVIEEEKLAIFDASGVPREYVEDMDNGGTGTSSSDNMISYEHAVREGYFAVCSHHLQLITGPPALSLGDVFLANKEAAYLFPFAVIMVLLNAESLYRTSVH